MINWTRLLGSPRIVVHSHEAVLAPPGVRAQGLDGVGGGWGRHDDPTAQLAIVDLAAIGPRYIATVRQHGYRLVAA